MEACSGRLPQPSLECSGPKVKSKKGPAQDSQPLRQPPQKSRRGYCLPPAGSGPLQQGLGSLGQALILCELHHFLQRLDQLRRQTFAPSPRPAAFSREGHDSRGGFPAGCRARSGTASPGTGFRRFDIAQRAEQQFLLLVALHHARRCRTCQRCSTQAAPSGYAEITPHQERSSATVPSPPLPGQQERCGVVRFSKCERPIAAERHVPFSLLVAA